MGLDMYLNEVNYVGHFKSLIAGRTSLASKLSKNSWAFVRKYWIRRIQRGSCHRVGFFFGSTEVDGWYWEDIQNTIDQLTPIIKASRDKNVWFEYQASW